MSEPGPRRADAHAHLFNPGWIGGMPEHCRRVVPDEGTFYEGLARQHGVEQLLAIGYQGSDWPQANNAYLAELAAQKPWVRPVAYVDRPSGLSVAMLEGLSQQRFVGVTMYLFDEARTKELAQVDSAVWQWLIHRRWLVSVNSRGLHWRAWPAVLERFGELRLLVSHLGLPPAMPSAPSLTDARGYLESVLALSAFPGSHVKLSGFYALSLPGHDYPHRAAWPYVEALLTAFRTPKLLWGSDYAPSLEFVSFPQTYDLFSQMPFLTAVDRAGIEGRNLLKLFEAVTRS